MPVEKAADEAPLEPLAKIRGDPGVLAPILDPKIVEVVPRKITRLAKTLLGLFKKTDR